MKYVLLGDGESPHLLKWARALAPRVDLWVASSRGFLPGFDEWVPAERRLALQAEVRIEGGNAGVLGQLPRLSGWLREVQPQWVNAHYLSSHGTLAWLASLLPGLRHLRGRLVASAWGSDVLLTPQRSAVQRLVLCRVLRASTLATSDSQYMAERMREFGAGEVMCFPFGLEDLPVLQARKDEALFFSNRALEPLYAPQRVLRNFAAIAAAWPAARLVVAHDGSLRSALESQAAQMGLAERVTFTGRLDMAAQAQRYAQARWYFSLPRSDSVSVSVLEAMAHGCVPVLSDLPANRELVRSGDNGILLDDTQSLSLKDLQPLQSHTQDIARRNHAWVAEHAMFGPSIDAFLARLAELAR